MSKIFFILLMVTACNQFVYDELYRSFLETALIDDNMYNRNLNIEVLRMLCNGQLSTWEIKNQQYSGEK